MARVIGVDVGGTKVATASLEDGVLGEIRTRPTEKESPDALVDQLVEAIEEYGDADAVGLGIPSVIDAARGMAMSSVNIPLQHVPLRDILGRRLNIPVHVDNDASVAALAEAHSEDGRLLAQSVVMFTVGTGVGGGPRPRRSHLPRGDELRGRVRPLDPLRRPDRRRAEARGLPAAGLDRARGRRAARWTGSPPSAGSATAAAPSRRPSAATATRSSACGSSASGSGWRSPTRSTPSTPSSS